MCHAPIPPRGKIPLAEVACKCGATGNWMHGKTDEEEFAGALRGLVIKALEDGIDELAVYEALDAEARRVKVGSDPVGLDETRTRSERRKAADH